MKPSRLLIACLIACLLSATLAAEAWAHPPPFFWMSDLSSDRRIGVDVSLGTSELGVDALPIVAASVFGDIALTEHVSIVGRIPFVYAQYAPLGVPEEESSALALGNAGVGVELAASSGGPGSTIRYGLEGYVHLPSAGDGVEQLSALVAAASVMTPDVGRYLADATTLRLRGGGRYEGASVFFQGELGLEQHLLDAADDTTDLLLGLGAGLDLSPYIAVLGELTVVSELRDNDDDREIRPSLDLGMRYHNPGMMAGVRVHWPFGERYRDAGVLAVAVDLAVRF